MRITHAKNTFNRYAENTHNIHKKYSQHTKNTHNTHKKYSQHTQRILTTHTKNTHKNTHNTREDNTHNIRKEITCITRTKNIHNRAIQSPRFAFSNIWFHFIRKFGYSANMSVSWAGFNKWVWSKVKYLFEKKKSHNDTCIHFILISGFVWNAICDNIIYTQVMKWKIRKI